MTRQHGSEHKANEDIHNISDHSAVGRSGLSGLRDMTSSHLGSFSFFILVSRAGIIILLMIALNL